MADDNKSNDKDKNPNKGGEFRVPPRTWIVWVAIIGSIVTLVMFKTKFESPSETLYSQRFLQLLESNLVVSASVLFNPQTHPVEVVEGEYKTDVESTQKIPFRTKIFLTDALQDKLNHLPSSAPH